MPRRTAFSAQTLAVLAALAARPSDWRHGYDLSRETGLKSGTLYPILMRLEQQQLLDAQWEDEPTPGKPRRHLYRVTALGAAEAARSSARTEAGTPRLVPAAERMA